MADYQLQVREAVEGSAQDEAQNMNRRLDVPAPGSPRQLGRHFRRKARVVGLHYRPRRQCRMEVERDLERLGTLQDRPEELVIQVAAPRVAIDHCPLEAMFTDRALQFIGGDLRSRG